MESRKQMDMKYPMRVAPPPPGGAKRPPVTSWQDDLFANDLFTNANPVQKKKPPPRPPPPKFTRSPVSNPDVPQRPAHFNRKPTILSSLINRKTTKSATEPANNEFQSHLILPPPTRNNLINSSNLPSLIDFSSPPSSPTLTTRSSSDGLSVDSFGSDITSSTANGHTHINGGNTSQAESGFEDDFDLLSNSKFSNNDVYDSWTGFDPFSPPKTISKLNVTRPIYDSDFLDPLCNGKTVKSSVQTHKIPTIIRAKPARPKAPKNSSLLMDLNLKPSYSNGSSFSSPVEEMTMSSGSVFDEGDFSPPMPSIPPPPPPPALEGSDDLVEDYSPDSRDWTHEDIPVPLQPSFDSVTLSEEPYGIALYDFPGTHSDDLPFRANDKIRLLKKLNEEWMQGRLRNGMEGMFPANFIQIVVPFPEEVSVPAIVPPQPARPPQPRRIQVTAMYDFIAEQDGDLGFTAGNKINVLSKVSDTWLYGEIGSTKGQFPSNYVDHVPADLPTKGS